MDPDWVDVFPIENGDIPASYVGLPEGDMYNKHKTGVSWTLKDSITIKPKTIVDRHME